MNVKLFILNQELKNNPNIIQHFIQNQPNIIPAFCKICGTFVGFKIMLTPDCNPQNIVENLAVSLVFLL